jgi:MFS family permease
VVIMELDSIPPGSDEILTAENVITQENNLSTAIPSRPLSGFWTPATRFGLMIALHAALATFLGAVTGEKTTFLYKEQLHLSASQLAALAILLGIPSYIQPFVGGWTDVFPLFGYHRRSYYVVGTLGIVCAYIGLALMSSYHLWSVVCLLLLSGSFSIFASVVKNAVMVAIGNRTGNFGRFQALTVFVPYILSLSYTSHFGGFVAQHWTYRQAYSTAAVIALLLLPLVFLMEDRRVGNTGPIENETQTLAEREAERALNRAKLREAAKSPQIWVTVAYVFYLIITPSPNSTYYFTDGLHLSKQFIGDLGRWNAVGALMGIGLFALGSRRLPVIALVVGAWLMDCAGYPCSLLMRNAGSVHWLSLTATATGIIYGLCLNTIAARACPPGIEGTIYGLVMAAIALAGNLCGLLGNWIYDYFGPANHHSVTYGWNASLIFGLLFTLPAGLLIPFLPADLKSRRSLQENRQENREASRNS